jgi:hypothetical protein
MKAPTLQSFLEECRAAKTSEALGGVIAQIECRREALRVDRDGLARSLEGAIVAGRAPGKVHTAIAQMDQDLMTLEAAQAGFGQKQADALSA